MRQKKRGGTTAGGEVGVRRQGLQQARADPTNPAHEMASSAEVRPDESD